jgi:hypothetical protein
MLPVAAFAEGLDHAGETVEAVLPIGFERHVEMRSVAGAQRFDDGFMLRDGEVEIAENRA